MLNTSTLHFKRMSTTKGWHRLFSRLKCGNETVRSDSIDIVTSKCVALEKILRMFDEKEMVLCGPEPDFPLLKESLAEHMMERMKDHPQDKIVHINADTGESLTVGEMLVLSHKIGQGLKKLNIQQGDVVALIGENGHRIHGAALGTVWQGGVFAPLDPTLKAFELLHMFRLYEPRFVFCDACVVDVVLKVEEQMKSDLMIIVLDSEASPCKGVLGFEEILEEADLEKYEPPVIKDPENELALIISSSGTTGLPKGCGITHSNMTFQMRAIETNSRNIPAGAVFGRYLQASHFFWISGIGALLFCCVTGSVRIFLTKINSVNILKSIHEYKPFWALLAPAEVQAMLNNPDFKKYDVSSMKFVMIVGSPLQEAIYEKFKVDWSSRTQINQSYGLSEFCGGLTSFEPGTDISSVGKLGTGLRLKVLNDEGKSLGPNQPGEICLTSPGLMKGYVGNEEATKAAVDENRWFHTGDIGYYNENGFIYVIDRKKELIKYRNHQISPAEIERLIMTISGVMGVGVVGIPNEEDGYHPMALVIKENASEITEDYIINYVKDNLSEHKQLRKGVKFVNELPRTPTKKLKRQQLKEMAMKLVAEY